MLVAWKKIALCLALTGMLLPVSLLAKDKKKDKSKQEVTEEAAEQEEDKWDVSNPPGDWKTLHIDTDETTWSNVDVSPDGKTILFDMLGDIYRVPIEGGEAEAVTDGIEWNFQPRFSPDGSRIAFISDRAGGDNLWVMNADGSDPVAVTEEDEHLIHNPSWSPDGDWIVAKKGFTSTRSIPAGEIWMYHRSGGDGLQLIERPNGEKDQKNIAEPAFSSDGRYIYFSQDTTSGRVWQYNKDATGQIFVIKRLDRDKGDVEVLVSGPGGAIRPTPSPDGKTLAFVRRLPSFRSAIYLKNLESGLEKAIYTDFERDLQETSGSHGNAPAISWTPDGRSIVFWSGGGIHRVDVETGAVARIPIRVQVDKKYQQALRFPVEVAPDEVQIKMPRWAQSSPDGSQVVFQALGHLYIRGVDGGEPRRLTSQSDHFEFYPSFSRDGRWIVYTTWHDSDLGSVRVVSVHGGEGRALTPKPGHYIEPSFSPNGKLVVYRKIAGGFLLSGEWSVEPGLYAVAMTGDEPWRILKSGSEPHFGVDPDRVYYSSSVDGARVLESVDLDGHEERTHLKGDKATSFRVSPDGRWVSFTEQFNVYVAPLPRTGKTVELSRKAKAVPVRQVSKRAGDFLHWSPTSDSLHWSNGPTLYRRDLRDAFAFLEGAPEELPEPVEEGLDLSFSVAADRPEGLLALVGGRIVTMRNANHEQEIIENGTILIRGNRIEAVGPAEQIDIPAAAFRLDVSGKTVIPGLLDVHAHGPMARNEIIPQQNRVHYSSLAFGVTTIHDPSNDTSSIFAAAEMQRAGLIVGPRVFSTGTILYGASSPGFTATIDSYEDALFHVQRMKDVGAISVKSYQQPRRDQRQQIIAAGRELGIMVVPEGGMKLQHNMTEIIDGHTGIEHSLTITKAYDDFKRLWAQTGSGYTPTFVVSFGGLSGENYWYETTEVWKNERLLRYTPHSIVDARAMRRPMAPEHHYNHIHVASFAKELRDLGVGVHIGAHGQREGLAAHWEMWMMEQGGFSPWEALRAGTIDGARYLGFDGDIGSIEKGKLADLVVIDGNPLEDLRRSEYVEYTVINGRVYDVETMNQIGNYQVERQPFYFEKEGGDTIHPLTQAWVQEMELQYGCQH